LATRTRALIRAVMPDVVEVPWPRQRVIGYGVRPGKMSEHFCSIAVHDDHVNLGFNYGAELPDPEGLLEGPGKLLRHTKITTPEDLSNPGLLRLAPSAFNLFPCRTLKADSVCKEVFNLLADRSRKRPVAAGAGVRGVVPGHRAWPGRSR